ncbi:MAG: hypothetical protein ACJAZM_003079 [Cyclobacteriaceae bacterium]|jgi:hypothetical protein
MSVADPISVSERYPRLVHFFARKTHIAPLVVFRIWFGSMMVISTIRFYYYGWIDQLYIQPRFFFSYVYFDWVKPLGPVGMYCLFVIMLFSAVGIMLGYRYRISTIVFFLTFTYVELIDKTNYLNHYYFVSLVAFLLIFIPAHRYCSLDAKRVGKSEQVPYFYLLVLQLQVGMVYCFAGIAKINSDWLLQAQPMKLWLGSLAYKPIIGPLFKFKFTSYLFSWAGMLYDLLIPFALLYKPTRVVAFIAVVVFHLLTWYLFPIGIFPWVMIGAATIFLPLSFHLKLTKVIAPLFEPKNQTITFEVSKFGLKMSPYILSVFILFQLLIPFRSLAYPGDVLWTEEGYRFSWRVMLTEKAGYASFEVVRPSSGKGETIATYDYLTPQQEKMMATQPDMILQFAHYVRDQYQIEWNEIPEVYASSYVSMNGRRSKELVDRTVDLAVEKRGWQHKTWVLFDE